MQKNNVILAGLLSLLFYSCSSSRKSTGSKDEIILSLPAKVADAPVKGGPSSNQVYDPIQIKYSKKLNVQPDKIKNLKLYKFTDKWMNTPYKWGGVDDKGIDCSAFVQRLLSEVYAINLPRTSVDQFLTRNVERFGSKEYLAEGDVIFFRTKDNALISHVGLYLHNNMFLNSSSSQGVSIASLENPYWKKCYVAAGRLR